MKEKTEKEFEIDGKKIEDLFEESKKRRLMFIDKNGETVASMVLLWAIVLAMLLWPLFVVASVLTVATGGSVKLVKKN